ncbi:unnamed protein product, partial [Citrullus colocynthis]
MGFIRLSSLSLATDRSGIVGITWVSLSVTQYHSDIVGIAQVLSMSLDIARVSSVSLIFSRKISFLS